MTSALLNRRRSKQSYVFYFLNFKSLGKNSISFVSIGNRTSELIFFIWLGFLHLPICFANFSPLIEEKNIKKLFVRSIYILPFYTALFQVKSLKV